MQSRSEPVVAPGDTTLAALVLPYPATFGPERTIGETIEALRTQLKDHQIIYVYVLDDQRRLLGVVAMRELLFGERSSRLRDVMLATPFHLRSNAPVLTAMREVLDKHYPIYPVCDAEGAFQGVVRGADLFEAQAVQITAQAGAMVGVDKEERTGSTVARSLRLRHPWLQVNLLTCIFSAAVVHLFEGIVSQFVILAVFLPVMVSQATNIGCQALAVALRGLTLGDVTPENSRAVVIKETSLGVLNGGLSGVTAAIGMYVYAALQGDPNAATLAAVVFAAMTGAALASGIAGVLVPLTLRRLGADPANASSIFLTTITEVAGLGMFLGLAAAFLR